MRFLIESSVRTSSSLALMRMSIFSSSRASLVGTSPFTFLRIDSATSFTVIPSAAIFSELNVMRISGVPLLMFRRTSLRPSTPAMSASISSPICWSRCRSRPSSSTSTGVRKVNGLDSTNLIFMSGSFDSSLRRESTTASCAYTSEPRSLSRISNCA